VAVDVVARSAEDRPATGRIELGDRLKERIEMDVGNLRVQQSAEAFDDTEYFDPGPVRALNRPEDRRIEGGSVSAGCEDADPLHGPLPSDCRLVTSSRLTAGGEERSRRVR